MSPNLGRILMVEDDPKDIDLTLSALEEYNLSNEVVVARDGEEALDYLYCRGKFRERTSDNPAVLLLDLKLPKIDGLEVLQHIKADERLKMIPVVVLHLIPRRAGHGGELQAWRECLRSEARGFSRIFKCHQGTRHFLGPYQ